MSVFRNTNFPIMCLILGCLFASACRRPAITQLAEFPHNIRYEQLNDVNGGVRVISYDYPNDSSFYTVIPGDVVWCEAVGGFIVGEKQPSPAPAYWMDIDGWNQRGFFLLNPTLLKPNETTDKRILADAVRWFFSRKDLDAYLQIQKNGDEPSVQIPKQSVK